MGRLCYLHNLKYRVLGFKLISIQNSVYRIIPQETLKQPSRIPYFQRILLTYAINGL